MTRTARQSFPGMRRYLNPSFAVAVAALVIALGGTAVAAGRSRARTHPRPCCMRVTKDGKLIGTHNDGTVKKAGVGIYDITFSTGPAGSKVPLDLEECAIFATPRVETASTPEEVARTSTSSASAARGSSSSRRAWCRSATTRSRRS